jgi:hypothetical protein
LSGTDTDNSEATSLTVFARSAVWITPQLGGLLDPANTPCPDRPEITSLLVRGCQPFDYSEEEKAKFVADPELLLTFRRALELQICDALDYCKMGSPKQKALFAICKKHMETVLATDEYLKEKLIPKYAVGCRRPTPGKTCPIK